LVDNRTKRAGKGIFALRSQTPFMPGYVVFDPDNRLGWATLAGNVADTATWPTMLETLGLRFAPPRSPSPTASDSLLNPQVWVRRHYSTPDTACRLQDGRPCRLAGPWWELQVPAGATPLPAWLNSLQAVWQPRQDSPELPASTKPTEWQLAWRPHRHALWQPLGKFATLPDAPGQFVASFFQLSLPAVANAMARLQQGQYAVLQMVE
jgi:hypothetical protein